MKRLAVFKWAALFAAPALFLSAARGQDPSGQPASPQEAFESWQEAHGSNWRLRTNPETGTAAFLWGGGAAPAFAPASDLEYEELARIWFDRARPMFGLSDAELVEPSVVDLPLSRIGSTDKVTVNFRQAVNGVPVVRGGASALFAPGGVLAALDTTGLPGLERLDTRPAFDRYAALRRAQRDFRARNGRAATEFGQPELVIYPFAVGGGVEARLAWAAELRAPAAGGLPLGERMYVDAGAEPGRVLGSDQLVHAQDIQGNAQGWSTPGTLPDIASNPETLQVMRGMTVNSPAGSALTDNNGDFSIPAGGGGPVNVTFTFDGPLVRVRNMAGADYSQVVSMTPGSPQNVVMNAGRGQYDTAHANAFDGVMDFNEFVHSVIPGDTTMDFRVIANVNINSSCNAFFNGGSINFFRASGSCVNTCYSTVIAHEEGHWANVKYLSGNGGDGFGEGGADIWAMFIYDNPIVGENFATSGGFIRTGNNTRQFCGDTNPGCYNQVHRDGEVLMGAFWKWRQNLNSTHGNAAGDAIADLLMLSWFNAYNDGQIRTIVEEHLLALDDDDTNIYNGTPNYADLDAGFRTQGFPGLELDVISVTHTELGNTFDDASARTVSADIEAVDGNFVVSADLVWSDGLSEQSVPMTPAGGGTWTADLPAQPFGSSIQYWINAQDDLGNTDKGPRGGDRWDYLVGTESILYITAMQNGNGFTHGATAGTDEWQNAAPAGGSGSGGGGWEDPGGPFLGLRVWGTDLGGNGAYAANSNTWLESPPVDCSNGSNVHMRFRRWLSVESNDLARILVNGVEMWRSPAGVNLADEYWEEIDLDISAVADGNPAVVLRFELQTNGSVQMGGWNLDDLTLFSVLAPGSMQLSGSVEILGTGEFLVRGVSPTARLFLLSSATANGSIIRGHAFDVSRPFVVEAGPVTPDPDGTYTFLIGYPAGTNATRWFEAAAGGNGNPITDSNVWPVFIH